AVDDAACVDGDGLASPDGSFGRTAVRSCSIRTRSDDAPERNRVGTLVVEELLDRPGELTFWTADEALLDQALEHAVCDRASALDRLEFRFLFDSAQALNKAPPRHGLYGPRAQGLVAGVRDGVSLEADRAGQPARKILEQRTLRLFALDALDGPGRLGVPEVAEKTHAVLLHQEG